MLRLAILRFINGRFTLAWNAVYGTPEHERTRYARLRLRFWVWVRTNRDGHRRPIWFGNIKVW